MARLTLWQRFRRFIGLPPKRPPEPPPPPPPSPPPPPPPPPPPGPYEFDRLRFQIWRDITDDYADYVNNDRETALEWWDLFLDTGAAFASDGGPRPYIQINYRWDGFLRGWWLNSSEAGSINRQDWLDETDTARILIDWDHWREIKKTP